MHRALIVFMACMAAGCASIGPTSLPERSPLSPQLHVWFLPSCPSTFDHPHGWITDATDLLFVKPEMAIVHAVTKALIPEAQVYKVMDGTDSGYLWWSDPKARRGVASCIVFAASDSDPATWCDPPHSPFAEARGGAICDYFRSAKTSSAGETLTSAHWKGSGLPRFYAEILLQPATGDGDLVPKGALYYYPAHLGPRKVGRLGRRSLLITVSATTAEGDGLALEDVVLPLTDIRPSDQLFPVSEVPAVSKARPSKVLLIPGEQGMQADHGIMSVKITGSVYESASSEAVLRFAAAVIGSRLGFPSEPYKVGR